MRGDNILKQRPILRLFLHLSEALLLMAYALYDACVCAQNGQH